MLSAMIGGLISGLVALAICYLVDVMWPPYQHRFNITVGAFMAILMFTSFMLPH